MIPSEVAVKGQRCAKAWLAGLGILGLMLGCTRRVEHSDSSRSRTPAATVVPAPSSQPGKGNPPTELLAVATSAYAAGLVVDGDTIYLLTDRVAHRFVPGKSPQQIPLENGGMAAVTRTDLVYWSQGDIWGVPKVGGKARRLAALPHRPQFFMAAGDDVAWLDMPSRDQFLIQTLAEHKVRTVFYYPGRIETATMDAGQVFFVVRDGDSAWRIGGVSTSGSGLRYAAAKTGPTPAKLAAAGDVFYYDLHSSELRRLSADLSHEDMLSRDLVCSPVAVSASVYCPNVEGLFELARQPGAKPRLLFPDRRRITNLAASPSALAWLSDAGVDRLSLMMVRLSPDGANATLQRQ